VKRFFSGSDRPQGRGFLSRFHASGEAGVTLVELLIAMTIFAVVAGGVAVGMGSALGLTRNNRNRSIAANLAAKEMDVVRSTDFMALPLTPVEHEETVDNVVYTINRTTDWVSKDGSSSECSPPEGTALAFLKVLVTVEWPDRQGVEPVKSETILSPPVGAYDSDTGHLAVRIRDRDAAPADNHVVTVVGPGGTFQQTTVDGCAFFVGLTPGAFTVSLGTSGHVDGQGVVNPEQSISVQAGSITSAEFDYDHQAALDMSMAGITGYGVPAGIGATVANTSLTLGKLTFTDSGGGGGGGGGPTCNASPSTTYSSADAAISEYSWFDDQNFGSDDLLGTYSSSGADTRSLVKFVLPTAPSGCVMDTATLRMFVNDAPGSTRTVQAYQVNAAWNEVNPGGVTWNNQPGTTGSPATATTPGSDNNWMDFGVTSIVAAQYAGTNHGFLLKDSQENGADIWVGMDPRERANDPQLVITWTSSGGGGGCDPTYSLVATEDARVRESSGWSNYGNESTFRVRTEKDGKDERSYLKFSLPVVSDCTLTAANLRLYQESGKSGRTIQVYRAAGSWSEGTVMWNNQPGWTGSPSSAASADGSGYKDWNVLSLVQAMYTGANDGFLMKDSSEGASSSAEQRYSSSENGTTTRRPVLELTFQEDLVLGTSLSVLATGLFPYSNGYQAWGGTCLDADPEGVDGGGQPFYPGAQRAPAIASNPNQTTPATLTLKSTDILVKLADDTPVANAAVRAFHDPDGGCPQGVTLVLGGTGADGYARVALPYGTWRFEVSGRAPVGGTWPTVVLSPLDPDPQPITVPVN
jgi:prepilin-type N-terminal cleavage/methylation domain-containing protein